MRIHARRRTCETSASPQASVGRWRRELPAELAAFLTAELRDELARFDYDADA
ncbi:MAG: hypothetical protein KIT14_14680 [bacterium]|nr:hypothetical protein [bacterium]